MPGCRGAAPLTQPELADLRYPGGSSPRSDHGRRDNHLPTLYSATLTATPRLTLASFRVRDV